jgi:hypothetical protein
MSKQEADTVSSDQLVSKQAIVMSYNRITKQASNQSFNHCKELLHQFRYLARLKYYSYHSTD